MPGGPTWQWRAGDPDLEFRHWGDEDEWVVYSPRSGDVHLLNTAACQLLVEVARRPLTESELAQCLEGLMSRPPAGDLEEAVRQAVQALDRAGLVEPVGL